MSDESKVQHIVVDAGGFIYNAPLKDLGVNLYSVVDVVREIKDKATRQRLQVLPYELIFREPSPEATKAVTDFAKKTGDYRSLSAVDIRVMALTYQLEKEHVGTKHIKTAPGDIAWTSTKKHLENPAEIAGFYIGKATPANSRTTSISRDSGVDADNLSACVADVHLDNVEEETNEGKDKDITPDEGSTNKDDEATGNSSPDGDKENVVDSEATVYQVQDGDAIPASCVGEALSDDSDSESDEEEEDDDDEDGWITPGNIKDVKKAMGAPEDDDDKADVPVGCLTTDFAMQNVLIQMGLNVLSVNGLLIRRAKSYVLRCFACMKITSKLELQFCPHCGNKTLQKVSMSVNDDGSVRYYFSRRKPISVRGLKYSLPKPQGGKHAKNPILCADQREAQQRTSKAGKVKYNPFDADYLAKNSPFAPVDVTSRAALLGIKSQRGGDNFKKRRNPNENNKNYGRRK